MGSFSAETVQGLQGKADPAFPEARSYALENLKLRSKCKAAAQTSFLLMAARGGASLVLGTGGDVAAGSDVPWCPMLCSWLCKVKEQLPHLPGCGASALTAAAGNLLQQVFPCFNSCLRFEGESQEDGTEP